MIEHKSRRLSVKKQCRLLGLTRSTLYYEPVGPSSTDLELMRAIDEQYLKTPFFGCRRMTWQLRQSGFEVNRKKVRRLMKVMGIRAIYPRPRTSDPCPGHKIYPYLLGGISIDRLGQVYATDITYIPLAKGFVYLVAVIDWHSRFIVGWRLSNSLDSLFCIEALQDSFAYGIPDILNSDQGSQFTSLDFTDAVTGSGAKMSMDGKGRWMDNVFVERLWRSLKYEDVYLKGYDSVESARQNIAEWIRFYNFERPHQALGYRTPWDVFSNKSETPNDAGNPYALCPLITAAP